MLLRRPVALALSLHDHAQSHSTMPSSSCTDVFSTAERRGVLMGIEIRLFPSIDAFSRFSGTAIACSTGLFLELAKQLLESTAAASGRGRASVGGGVAAGPWRRLEKAPLTPRITRFLVPANTGSSVASES